MLIGKLIKAKNQVEILSVLSKLTRLTITAYKGGELDVKSLDLFAETSIIEFSGTFHDASSCGSLMEKKNE
jgi:hypothetical protein